MDGKHVVLENIGQALSTSERSSDEEEFGTYLRTGGGDWMWDDIKCKGGIDAVVDAFANGTAIPVTEGSFKRKVRSDLCGSGWLIYCTERHNTLLEGSFYDICSKAGSYTGDLLVLLALHVFTQKLESFYGFEGGHKAVIACDNLGGLNKSRERRKKIPPSAKNADILWSLRKLHAQIRAKLTYQHIYGHQDKYKRWE